MSYIDCYLAPVPVQTKAAYEALAGYRKSLENARCKQGCRMLAGCTWTRCFFLSRHCRTIDRTALSLVLHAAGALGNEMSSCLSSNGQTKPPETQAWKKSQVIYVYSLKTSHQCIHTIVSAIFAD